MIAYLRERPLFLPEPVSTPPAEDGAGEGTVTASFEVGDLFLEDEEGGSFRLSWSPDDEERTRALPVGEYDLRTYRIVREADGELWHVSATKPSIRTLVVREGENTAVEVDDRIHLRSRLGARQAAMMITGDDGAGLSIYRDGKRIPIDYSVLGPDGAELAAGRMRYG